MIVREVEAFGGDVVKFAGDALIVEWQATPSCPIESTTDSGHCDSASRIRKKYKINKDIVVKVALCAANIVDKCSDYPVYDEDGSKVSTLNVYCGIGYGRCVGVHAGDDERKEYLLLGSPLKQVALCIDAASAGEVLVSPEAWEVMEPLVDFEEDAVSADEDSPRIIATKSKCNFLPKDGVDVEARGAKIRKKIEQQLAECDNLALKRLQESVSLFVHPSAVQDEITTRALSGNGNTGESKKRHKSKAELRGVFTLFIMPVLKADLTGPNAEDTDVLLLLNKVMLTVNTELGKFSGHLRQFIQDDKGKKTQLERKTRPFQVPV
jgi:hypothetical protein